MFFLYQANIGFEPQRTIDYKNIVDEAITKSNISSDQLKCIIFNRPEGKQANLISGRDRDWNDVIWAITTRMDPARDTTMIENTPIDYLDFASPSASLGSKIEDLPESRRLLQQIPPVFVRIVACLNCNFVDK